ncbi:MAG: elongation factor P [Candidatus Actinomarina sp.]|jgi:elongation factor P|tara:strand:+ start:411 stop:950 length:540 start_codon:yes stop_codon:yes gene_type:complete
MRPGQSILVDNILYQILEYQHVKPGKGKAFVKTKLKNLTNGGQLEKTFRADEDVQQAFIDKQSFQFLYNDSDEYYFMNNESFDQISLNKSILNNQEILLKPNEEVTIAMHENNPIDIILPTTVTLKVTHSEPAVKGDSVNSSTKEVTCETGFTLQVPMFINENELIKIDTKTQTYITRA